MFLHAKFTNKLNSFEIGLNGSEKWCFWASEFHHRFWIWWEFYGMKTFFKLRFLSKLFQVEHTESINGTSWCLSCTRVPVSHSERVAQQTRQVFILSRSLMGKWNSRSSQREGYFGNIEWKLKFWTCSEFDENFYLSVFGSLINV